MKISKKMNTIGKVCLAFTCLAFISCNDSHVEDHDSMNTDADQHNVENRSTDDGDKTIKSEDNHYSSSVNTEDMQTMYRALAMSEDQINRFEKDLREKLDNSNTDKNRTMDKDKLQREKDQSLKKVLSDNQYEQYENWKKEAASREN